MTMSSSLEYPLGSSYYNFYYTYFYYYYYYAYYFIYYSVASICEFFLITVE